MSLSSKIFLSFQIHTDNNEDGILGVRKNIGKALLDIWLWYVSNVRGREKKMFPNFFLPNIFAKIWSTFVATIWKFVIKYTSFRGCPICNLKLCWDRLASQFFRKYFEAIWLDKISWISWICWIKCDEQIDRSDVFPVCQWGIRGIGRICISCPRSQCTASGNAL